MKVDRTPECHPKMAGEVINYNWLSEKGFYCHLQLYVKKPKAGFCEFVKICLGIQDVLTIERQEVSWNIMNFTVIKMTTKIIFASRNITSK